MLATRTAWATSAFIPAPPGNGLHLGPFELRAYGLMIALGVIAALAIAQRRWQARGHDPDDITALAFWTVPAGVIGARIYHVATDPELFRGRWLHAFAIWEGGLGIPGGLLAGVAVGYVVARRRGLPVPELLDTVAPAIPVAQAIGRWGNWFNQELFGRPSTLPWALRVDPAHRPEGYERIATFQPTFLYESLWNLALAALLVFVVERHLRLRPGRLFALYVGGYGVGRLWVESLRIDHANRILGLRVNEWVSLFAIAGAAAVFLTDWLRGRPDAPDATGSPAETDAAPDDAAADTTGAPNTSRSTGTGTGTGTSGGTTDTATGGADGGHLGTGDGERGSTSTDGGGSGSGGEGGGGGSRGGEG